MGLKQFWCRGARVGECKKRSWWLESGQVVQLLEMTKSKA